MNKSVGLYIGCGTDFKIMSLLQNDIDTCIYIDSQPLTSYGELYNNSNNCIHDFSKTYMIHFREEANKAGFMKISIDGVYPHIYRNHETSQDIYHYFSLVFPINSINANYIGNRDEITKLIHLLSSVTYLIVIGYSPHYSVCKYISNQICFIGTYSTIYKDNLDDLLPNEQDKITNILQKDKYDIRYKIKTYVYFDKNENKNTYKTYDDFINKTIEM